MSCSMARHQEPGYITAWAKASPNHQVVLKLNWRYPISLNSSCREHTFVMYVYKTSFHSINCSLLSGLWHNSAVCFFCFVVVECQCDLKLLTAPGAYTALGSCCLSVSIICIDGYSLSASLTVNLYFSSVPSHSPASVMTELTLAFYSYFCSLFLAFLQGFPRLSQDLKIFSRWLNLASYLVFLHFVLTSYYYKVCKCMNHFCDQD